VSSSKVIQRKPPLTNSPEVLAYIRGHFSLDGEVILRDGQPARGTASSRGYFSVRIGEFGLPRRSVYWRRGRLKWFLHTGELPPEIDHRDCDPGNDALANLRPATRQLNNLNRRLFKKANGLPRGVYFEQRTGRYRAQITIGGVVTSFGTHATAEEASAKIRAATKVRSHKNRSSRRT
jgi:hypothetical protein